MIEIVLCSMGLLIQAGCLLSSPRPSACSLTLTLPLTDLQSDHCLDALKQRFSENEGEVVNRKLQPPNSLDYLSV